MKILQNKPKSIFWTADVVFLGGHSLACLDLDPGFCQDLFCPHVILHKKGKSLWNQDKKQTSLSQKLQSVKSTNVCHDRGIIYFKHEWKIWKKMLEKLAVVNLC